MRAVSAQFARSLRTVCEQSVLPNSLRAVSAQFAHSLRTVCAHFAHSLRTVSGPEFPFLGVRKRGRGKNPRPPRNEFGPKSTLPANFFGARYRQKAVGSNANLRPSAAREIIMVTKERLGGGRRREKRRTGEGPCNSIATISS